MKIWGEKVAKCQWRIHELLLQDGEVMKVEALSPLEESWPGLEHWGAPALPVTRGQLRV